MTDIKFCGLMRPADVRVAIDLGAAFVGAVFAGGPRTVTAQQARALFDGVSGPRRVGVFGDQSIDEIARVAQAAELDVIQLHADPTPELVSLAKAATGLETWAAVRLATSLDQDNLQALASSADAILFDSRRDGALGGTGHAFDWGMLTNMLDQHRENHPRFILAGGLTPALVSAAIAAVRPDIVDVSSGVESTPGVKYPALMRAFVSAVRGAR
jgi:phosphoribosylanthranilate isomerase